MISRRREPRPAALAAALAAWVIATAPHAGAEPASAEPAVAEPASAEPATMAQINYMIHCQGCHLADGAGSEGKVPMLRGSVARYLTVPGGREYLIRIPGVSQSPLGDEDLALVLNWVVQRFGPAEAAAGQAPFSAAEIASLRRPPLMDPTAVRSELLHRMAAAPSRAETAPGTDPRRADVRARSSDSRRE